MNRDQRAEDNWALLYAQELAREECVIVVFCLTEHFPGANLRHYGFMLRGLRETAGRLEKMGIPFYLLRGEPGEMVPRFVKAVRAAALVTDFFSLRVKNQWIEQVADELGRGMGSLPVRVPPVLWRDAGILPACREDVPSSLLKSGKAKKQPGNSGDADETSASRQNAGKMPARHADETSATRDIPFFEVDAHNIVPAWEASDKQEYMARTLRGRLTPLLKQYLTEMPKLRRGDGGTGLPARPVGARRGGGIDWEKLLRSLKIDRSVGEVDWLTPGPAAANRMLKEFIRDRLPRYHKLSNDPSQDVQSQLSPYLHFGQIAPQRVALEVRKARAPAEAKKVFLEQLIVRRELSDNFCLYCEAYDSYESLPRWARQSLARHARDKRPYLYSLAQLESAATHDDLWNAAQREMVRRGKMHGYMRMYWAKKILEWSPTPQEAFRRTLYLNDKYFLDGRDPNGYANVAWAIGALHDTPFPRRKVFGNIRYMSRQGCERKFSVRNYINSI